MIYLSQADLGGLLLPSNLLGKSFKVLLKNPIAPLKMEVFARFKNAETIVSKRYIFTIWFDFKENSTIRMKFGFEKGSREYNNLAFTHEYQELAEELETKIEFNIRGKFKQEKVDKSI